MSKFPPCHNFPTNTNLPVIIGPYRVTQSGHPAYSGSHGIQFSGGNINIDVTPHSVDLTELNLYTKQPQYSFTIRVHMLDGSVTDYPVTLTYNVPQSVPIPTKFATKIVIDGGPDNWLQAIFPIS